MSAFDQTRKAEGIGDSLIVHDDVPLDRAQQKSLLHYALIGLGWAFVAIAVVGIFLPVLPTTPFVLLALWCFARSSRRFHDWLYHHPRLGSFARAWREHQVIPVQAKLLAVTMMTLSQLYVVFVVRIDWYWALAMGLTLLAVACWIVTRPSRPPEP